MTMSERETGSLIGSDKVEGTMVYELHPVLLTPASVPPPC